MNLKEDYDKLYQHWLKEFQQKKLTSLIKEDYSNYRKNHNRVNKFEINGKNKIESQLLNSYSENFNFLFKDLLQIRKIKILNFALALQEINLNDLLEAEKFLYQNVVSSIKGYKKLKKIYNFEEREGEMEEIIGIPMERRKLESSLKNTTPDNSSIITSEQNANVKDTSINYTLIRFLKKVPPLVGIDLINYGPFEKEDVVNIPFENARILIDEKFAEIIDIFMK